VRAAFADFERPEHFTDYKHCEECAEHDALLRSRGPGTPRAVDVGNPGRDPLCYVSPAGFGYLLPGLARQALSEPGPQEERYTPQLLFHLPYGGEAVRHLRAYGPDQRRAVAGPLWPSGSHGRCMATTPPRF
jgi:hypothetical protein